MESFKRFKDIKRYSDAIVHIAPKGSIENTNILSSDTGTISSSSSQWAKNYLIVYKQTLIDKTFEEVIESDIEKFGKFENHIMVKINDSYYESIVEVKKSDNKLNVLEQYFKVVYMKEEDYYYRMAFVFTLIDKNKYIPDMQFILNSIRFKNPDTQSKFRPKS